MRLCALPRRFPSRPPRQRPSLLPVSILLILALSGFSMQAAAATYYVRADGSDANSGTGNSPAAAWRTLTKANNTLRAGDVVNVISLSPADTASATVNQIQPVNAGNNSAGGAGRITYNGNPSNPASLSIPKVTITKSYVTVRGFRVRGGYAFNGSTTGGAVVYSVLEQCIVESRVAMRGAQYCRSSKNVMRLTPPTNFASVYFAGADDLNGKPWCQQDTLSDNYIELGRTGGDHRTFFVRGFTNNTVIARNRVYSTCDRNASPTPGLTAYVIAIEESFANYYHDNRWEFEIANALDSPARWSAIATRSGTHHNLFERDTVFWGVNSAENLGCDLSLGQVSALRDSAEVYANRWKSCYYKAKNATIRFQHRLKDGGVENCVFVNLVRPGLEIEDNPGVSFDNSVIRHNTFYSRDSPALRIGARVQILNSSVVESNIFLTGATSSCSRGSAEWPQSSNMTTNRNLFFASSGPSSAALRSNSACYSVGPGSSACNTLGDECQSVWANPQLANTSFASFDPSLLSGSPAIAAQFANGYAGAIPGIDAVAPGQVTNLGTVLVGDKIVVLSWNAPGDDGQSGTISGYDLRWSTQPITSANFAAATPASPQPQIGGAGALQTHVLYNLTPGTPYFVALRARDEANNYSVISNVVALTTASTDVIQPAPVGDLGAP